MMHTLVELLNVTKTFGSKRAVHDLSFTVARGEIFGLIGPDGAGKTTLLRMLVTLLRPDHGSILIDGFDTVKDVEYIRAIIGYMPQRFSLYPDLSVEQNLRFFADLFEVPKDLFEQRKERLYAFSRLRPFASRLAGKLSGGMKQKLALSCTLVHDPILLVLDEATTGVDPVSRVEFWNILDELRAEGMSIIVSTPYMDEALLCDRVIIMHEGSMLRCAKPTELIAEYPWPVFALEGSDLMMRMPSVESLPGVRDVQAFGDGLHVTTELDVSVSDIEHALSRIPGDSVNIRSIQPSFEDVFIAHVYERLHHD